MGHWIKSLSDRSEFIGVLTLAFGWTIASSVSMALSNLGVAPPQPADAQTVDPNWLAGVLCMELPILAMIGLFLRERGWTWSRLGSPPSWRDVLPGLSLALGTALLFWLAQMIAASVGLETRAPDEAVPVQAGMDWPLILAVSAVNGFYEEALVCGYLIAAMRDKRSMWTAIHLSTAIRVAYHLYQGDVGVISIVPMGLAYAWLYAVTGRLWPLVLAHIVLDAWALGAA
ncbi:CPBP family intramembrane glutamic endopeptidase [Lysobacter enzymogenes]|uniref:CPBP family intramembrane glutamic endopeptidase n=1 Tax=Lysobacter enzymogenes TaxID=69 RepID=UPI001A95F811|nr:type II CAAX endopeptidase family protein [Lysobacter enzymogenes]QQP97783.1 CPBP family intramembrane metalloprotease [Lysobacter enzymogenes]